ncbi:DUF1996 domain-containing protein [Phytohabitans sp. ZYX-F-186]|uniref:DUF1996 domain-containing protein n=1 Tax=Phytohabitans maris TaxID=3071409 RepID=A0ABU0ZH52_9ACTN|nr:DUF1996 domain-containing protein [Phytohabitans sp. ZYX-F-186]MDQ7906386.1 DUF1996 domain-containing protein [Phytohabitans sp. ZYX-F-186]
MLIVGVELALAAAAISVPLWTSAPPRAGYVEISAVPPAPADPATRAYTWSCGRNEEGHRNTANLVVVPGVPGPPHHVHEYVGNLSTDVDSTDASLAAATTSCPNGDLSTYYWPVLRTGARAGESRHGEIVGPVAVTLTAYGNPVSPVVAMPPLLRGTVGDANTATTPIGQATRSWTCSGTPERRTDRYPLCPPGDRVVRVFDFPSCWDGRRADSLNHRAHLTFPAANGSCPAATFAVPRLRLTVEYPRPDGDRFAIDAFPPQRNAPQTDHAFFVNLMPEQLMARVVGCLNTGAECA